MVVVVFAGCDSRVLTLSLFAPPVNNLQVSVEMLQDKASDQYLHSLATMHWNLPGKSAPVIKVYNCLNISSRQENNTVQELVLFGGIFALLEFCEVP